MRTPLAVAAAVATASAVAVVGSSGSAFADLTLPSPSLSPLPSVSVPVPVPTQNPVPLPSAPSPGSGDGQLPGTGDPAGTGDSSQGGGTEGEGSAAGSGPAAAGTTGSAAASGAGSTGRARSPERAREKRANDATPMVAGTARARDLLDDESSPQLLAASRDFLAADRAIAEIARQKRVMARLKQTAAEQAATYKALDMDVLTARVAADNLHERHDAARRELVVSARKAYTTGQPTTDDGTTAGLAAAVARLQDGSTRADKRHGELIVLRDAVRADFDHTAARYREAKRRLADANERVAVLAAQRSTAVTAVRAARGSDLALHRARLAESGELGAQIRAATVALDRTGRTVTGTGAFTMPAGGQLTSPFGMRFHPILRYTKLHTGTDFAGGDLAVRAADDGRVLMTVVSAAYGNLTVVDHGVIDGERVTTAYAHQAQFLVREGQAVRRGEQIGIVGSTGYSTGPHLHFEVREDGTVVDPATWLARG